MKILLLIAIIVFLLIVFINRVSKMNDRDKNILIKTLEIIWLNTIKEFLK